MREIKFRVWDKNDLEILSWEYCNRNHWDLYTMFEQKTEIYPLMQYTGLKDKNGKEIYESDIYHMGDINITYTVVWHDAGLIGKQNGSRSHAGLSSWQDQIEVIGNIYENQELLSTV